MRWPLVLPLAACFLLGGCGSSENATPSASSTTAGAVPPTTSFSKEAPVAGTGSSLPGTGMPCTDALPGAVELACQDLAAQLGIDVTSITVKALASVQWRDTCLGVQRPDQACGQMITPGYQVVFVAEDREYRYHTDQRTSFRPAN